MNYASLDCAMRKVSLLCGVISFGNACGMQLALVGQPPRKSPVVEIARKNFSHAMHHMQKLIPEIQMPIALYVFDHNSEAADKFMQMPLEEKMKDYANAKAIFNKEALKYFGEAADLVFSLEESNEWQVGTIFVSFDEKSGLHELRLVNKILIDSFFVRHRCNRAEAQAFLAIAEKFKKIKLEKPVDSEHYQQRDLTVLCQEEQTISNFMKKISLEQQTGAIVCAIPCMAAGVQHPFLKGMTYFLGLPLLMVNGFCRQDKQLIIESVKKSFTEEKRKMGTIALFLASISFAIDKGASLLLPFVSSSFKNQFIANGFVLACYGTRCLSYNFKQIKELKPRSFTLHELSEALNDPNIVIP